MTSANLENKCREKFGDERSRLLYESMRAIAKKDFCVATGWTDHEISISKSCLHRGKIFVLSEDYQSIVVPGFDITVPITKLAYKDFCTYLPLIGLQTGFPTHHTIDDQ